MSEYRAKLVRRREEILAFLKVGQAQLQQAVAELNKIEGSLEGFEAAKAEQAKADDGGTFAGKVETPEGVYDVATDIFIPAGAIDGSQEAA